MDYIINIETRLKSLFCVSTPKVPSSEVSTNTYLMCYISSGAVIVLLVALKIIIKALHRRIHTFLHFWGRKVQVNQDNRLSSTIRNIGIPLVKTGLRCLSPSTIVEERSDRECTSSLSINSTCIWDNNFKMPEPNQFLTSPVQTPTYSIQTEYIQRKLAQRAIGTNMKPYPLVDKGLSLQEREKSPLNNCWHVGKSYNEPFESQPSDILQFNKSEAKSGLNKSEAKSGLKRKIRSSWTLCCDEKKMDKLLHTDCTGKQDQTLYFLEKKCVSLETIAKQLATQKSMHQQRCVNNVNTCKMCMYDTGEEEESLPSSYTDNLCFRSPDLKKKIHVCRASPPRSEEIESTSTSTYHRIMQTHFLQQTTEPYTTTAINECSNEELSTHDTKLLKMLSNMKKIYKENYFDCCRYEEAKFRLLKYFHYQKPFLCKRLSNTGEIEDVVRHEQVHMVESLFSLEESSQATGDTQFNSHTDKEYSFELSSLDELGSEDDNKLHYQDYDARFLNSNQKEIRSGSVCTLEKSAYKGKDISSLESTSDSNERRQNGAESRIYLEADSIEIAADISFKEDNPFKGNDITLGVRNEYVPASFVTLSSFLKAKETEKENMTKNIHEINPTDDLSTQKDEKPLSENNISEYVKPLNTQVTPMSCNVKPLDKQMTPKNTLAQELKPLDDPDQSLAGYDDVKSLDVHVKPLSENVKHICENVKPSKKKVATLTKKTFNPKSVGSVQRRENTKEMSKVTSLVRPMALLELLLGREKQAVINCSQEKKQSFGVESNTKSLLTQQLADKTQRAKEAKVNSKSSFKSKFSVKNWKPGVLKNMKRELDNKCRLRIAKKTELNQNIVSCMNEICGPSNSTNSLENGADHKSNKPMSVSVDFVTFQSSDCSVFRDTAELREFKTCSKHCSMNSPQGRNTGFENPVQELTLLISSHGVSQCPQQQQSPGEIINGKSPLRINTLTTSPPPCNFSAAVISPHKVNTSPECPHTMKTKSSNRISTLSPSPLSINTISTSQHKFHSLPECQKEKNLDSRPPQGRKASPKSPLKVMNDNFKQCPPRIDNDTTPHGMVTIYLSKHSIHTDPQVSQIDTNHAPQNELAPHRLDIICESPNRLITVLQAPHELDTILKYPHEMDTIPKSQHEMDIISQDQGKMDTIPKSPLRIEATPQYPIRMTAASKSTHRMTSTTQSSPLMTPILLSPHGIATIPLTTHGIDPIPISSHGINTLPKTSHGMTSTDQSPQKMTINTLASHRISQSPQGMTTVPQSPPGIITMPQTSQRITTTRQSSHRMTSPPQSKQRMSTIPRSPNKISTTSESLHGITTITQTQHEKATIPQSPHGKATFPLSSREKTTVPKSPHGKINILQSPPGNTDFPQPPNRNTAFPQSRNEKTTIPQSSHENITLPQSSRDMITVPKSPLLVSIGFSNKVVSSPEPIQSMPNSPKYNKHHVKVIRQSFYGENISQSPYNMGNSVKSVQLAEHSKSCASKFSEALKEVEKALKANCKLSPTVEKSHESSSKPKTVSDCDYNNAETIFNSSLELGKTCSPKPTNRMDKFSQIHGKKSGLKDSTVKSTQKRNIPNAKKYNHTNQSWKQKETNTLGGYGNSNKEQCLAMLSPKKSFSCELNEEKNKILTPKKKVFIRRIPKPKQSLPNKNNEDEKMEGIKKKTVIKKICFKAATDSRDKTSFMKGGKKKVLLPDSIPPIETIKVDIVGQKAKPIKRSSDHSIKLLRSSSEVSKKLPISSSVISKKFFMPKTRQSGKSSYLSTSKQDTSLQSIKVVGFPLSVQPRNEQKTIRKIRSCFDLKHDIEKSVNHGKENYLENNVKSMKKTPFQRKLQFLLKNNKYVCKKNLQAKNVAALIKRSSDVINNTKNILKIKKNEVPHRNMSDKQNNIGRKGKNGRKLSKFCKGHEKQSDRDGGSCLESLQPVSVTSKIPNILIPTISLLYKKNSLKYKSKSLCTNLASAALLNEETGTINDSIKSDKLTKFYSDHQVMKVIRSKSMNYLKYNKPSDICTLQPPSTIQLKGMSGFDLLPIKYSSEVPTGERYQDNDNNIKIDGKKCCLDKSIAPENVDMKRTLSAKSIVSQSKSLCSGSPRQVNIEKKVNEYNKVKESIYNKQIGGNKDVSSDHTNISCDDSSTNLVKKNNVTLSMCENAICYDNKNKPFFPLNPKTLIKQEKFNFMSAHLIKGPSVKTSDSSLTASLISSHQEVCKPKLYFKQAHSDLDLQISQAAPVSIKQRQLSSIDLMSNSQTDSIQPSQHEWMRNKQSPPKSMITLSLNDFNTYHPSFSFNDLQEKNSSYKRHFLLETEKSLLPSSYLPISEPKMKTDIKVNKPNVCDIQLNKQDLSDIQVNKPDLCDMKVNKPDLCDMKVSKQDLSDRQVNKQDFSDIQVNKQDLELVVKSQFSFQFSKQKLGLEEKLNQTGTGRDTIVGLPLKGALRIQSLEKENREMSERKNGVARETCMEGGVNASLEEIDSTSLSIATELEAISYHFGDDVTLKSCSNQEFSRRSLSFMEWNSMEKQSCEHKRKKTMKDASPLVEFKKRRLSVYNSKKKKNLKYYVRLMSRKLFRKCDMKSLTVCNLLSNPLATSQTKTVENNYHLKTTVLESKKGNPLASSQTTIVDYGNHIITNTLESKEEKQKQATNKSEESFPVSETIKRCDPFSNVPISEDLESLLNLELTGFDEGLETNVYPEVKLLFSRRNRNGKKVDRSRRRSCLNLGRVAANYPMSRENSVLDRDNKKTESNNSMHSIHSSKLDGKKSKKLTDFLLNKRQCEMSPIYIGQVARSKGSTVTSTTQSSEEEERLLAVLEQPFRIHSSRSRGKTFEPADCPPFPILKSTGAVSERVKLKPTKNWQECLKENSNKESCCNDNPCSDDVITAFTDMEEVDLPSEHYIHCVVPQNNILDRNMSKEYLSLPTHKSTDCGKKKEEDNNESTVHISSNISKSSLPAGLESHVNSFSNQSKSREVHFSDMFLTQSTIDRIHNENELLTVDNKSSSSSSIVLSWIGSDVSEVDNVLDQNTHRIKCSKTVYGQDGSLFAGKSGKVCFDCLHTKHTPISPFKLDPIETLNNSMEIYCDQQYGYVGEQSIQLKNNTRYRMASDNQSLLSNSNYLAFTKTSQQKDLIDQAAVFHNNQVKCASDFPFTNESGQDFTSCSETVSGGHSLGDAGKKTNNIHTLFRKTKQEHTGRLQINIINKTEGKQKKSKLKMKVGPLGIKQNTLTSLRSQTLKLTDSSILPSTSLKSKTPENKLLSSWHKKTIPSTDHLPTTEHVPSYSSNNSFVSRQSKFKNSKSQHSNKKAYHTPARENATSDWYKPQYVPLSPSLTENHSWPLNMKSGSSKANKSNVQAASSEPLNCTGNKCSHSETNSDVDTFDALSAETRVQNHPTDHMEGTENNPPAAPQKVKNIIQMFEQRKKIERL